MKQLKTNGSCILMDICGIQKDGTSEPICKAEIEIQMQRTNAWPPKKEAGVQDESRDWD